MTNDLIFDRIDKNKLPKHIAIIMDGNGRWAKKQGLERFNGHIKGAETVKIITECCAKLNIKYLTLYSFSTENWNRPKDEIDNLMNLLAESIEKEFENLNKNNIRLRIIGDIKKLPIYTQDKINFVLENTKNNTHLNLIMALNYSSKWEILNAVNNIQFDILNKNINFPVNEKIFEKYLATSDFPDPELLIRTGGEKRISNFLMYQLAYTELYFTDTYWPEYSEKNFYETLIDYQNRERRFGKTSEQLK